MIDINNVTKKYTNHHVAVNQLSLRVKRGAFFGFLGANGAGKTTTIKMMTGLLKPTSGSILIGGYNIQTHPLEAKRLFSYVPDRPILYEKLTAREYIGFMAKLYGMGIEYKPQMELLLERFSLQSNADKMIQTYSHGMKQKTAIIAALIHNPELIILDEPTVGLDPEGAKTLKEVLHERTNDNKTVFICTHILEIAERLCDQIAIMKAGNLLEYQSVKALKAQYANQSLENIYFEILQKNVPTRSTYGP